ncbi:MAG: biopolymer transporter ExbD [Gemmataceae bacterium]
MSHGGGDDNVDPDLTPLLDLVLQMLMFFIINVNFVSEQVSPEIKLPDSESARPVSKADPAAIFLNQKLMTREFRNTLSPRDAERLRNADSVVLIPSVPPMSLLEAKAWLKDKYENLQKLAGGGEVKTIIHFRPDGDLEYSQLLTLMNYCKVAGFNKLKVRARVKKGA